MRLRSLLIGLSILVITASCTEAATPAPTSTPNLNATPAVTATPDIEALREAAMMYEQDFESGIPGGIFVWTDWTLETDEIGNHAFCNVPMDGWPGGTIGQPTWTDYAAEMKVRFDELEENQGGQVNVRINQDASQKYYGELNHKEALLSFGGPYVQIGLLKYKARAGNWYTLRLEAAGDQFKFLVNEANVAHGSDSTRSEGFAGFTVFPNTRVCIDDIRIWALEKDGSIARREAPTESAAASPLAVADRLAAPGYPRLKMSFGRYRPSDEDLRHAALGDLVRVDVAAIVTRPEYFGPDGVIRSINPNAVIVAYWSMLDLQLEDHNFIRATFNSQIAPEWTMQDVRGQMYYLFPAMGDDWNPMLDLSTDVSTFMPAFLNDTVMKSGLVDGIFFDWLGEDMSGLNGPRERMPAGRIDVDRDGQVESDEEVNESITAGARRVLNLSRELFPEGSLLIGNSGGTAQAVVVPPDATSGGVYAGLLNGRQLETFLSEDSVGWMENMRAAALINDASLEPKVLMLTAEAAQDDYQHMRYSLASALMFDAYYIRKVHEPWFDAPPSQTDWWYDEYAVDFETGQAVESLDGKGYLGMPVSEGYNAEDAQELLLPLLLHNDTSAESKVWRRDFEHGIALVNPSRTARTIALGGTYRKILGLIDPAFNDGSVLTEVTLPARGGIVLLNMP